MKKVKTQGNVVLEHLKKYGHITSMEAITKYRITRLASVIFRLRKLGYNIDTIEKNGKNGYGAYTYADYILRGRTYSGN
ncbi:DNA-binding protein [bacterium]|nr:DNA-binding protein [bacterium]